MAISKDKKKEIVKSLGEKVAKQKAMVFADFTGLKVKDLSDLKKKLHESGAEFKVAKKTLMTIVFKDKNIAADPKKMQGEVALVMGYADEVSPARVVYEFSKTNKNIKILGGYLENKEIGLAEVQALAMLPSRQQLLANMVGSLSSPARNFAYVLQANITGLVRALSQIKKAE
jgi:large subunit ribosomal protein L10